MRFLVFLLAMLGGCVEGTRLAATLPHTRGTLRNGQPLARANELAFGTTVSTGAPDPEGSAF